MYRYELHMHTREGSACAYDSVHDMILRYKQLGYAGAAVTNHFIGGNTCVDRTLPWEKFVSEYSRAYFEGKETAEKLDFDLLFGVEQGYGGGKEFLVYGFEPSFLAENPQLCHGGAKAWADAVHRVGGFFAYAHPFRKRRYIPDPKAMPDISFADGIEAYNYCNAPGENEEAVRVFANSGKILIAGSDLHSVTFTEGYGVEFSHRVRTSAELAAALMKKEFTMYLG